MPKWPFFGRKNAVDAILALEMLFFLSFAKSCNQQNVLVLVVPKFPVGGTKVSCGLRSRRERLRRAQRAARSSQRSRASGGLKTAISRLEISICVWKTPKSWWLMHLCVKFTVVHFSRASGAHKRFPNASKFLGGVTSVFCQKKTAPHRPR